MASFAKLPINFGSKPTKEPGLAGLGAVPLRAPVGLAETLRTDTAVVKVRERRTMFQIIERIWIGKESGE
jgi:hypothetical protein